MVPWDGLIEQMDERVAVDVGAQSGPELCAGVLAARRLRELADLLEVHWLGELAAAGAQAIDAKADELFRRFTADHTIDPAIAVPPRATLRALALAELVRGGLAVDVGSTRPSRTEAVVVLRPDRPTGGAAAGGPSDVPGVWSWTATNPDGGALALGLLEALLCDSAATPLLLDRDGNPLYLGRSQRLASPAQRRALTVRDGGCVFPGCDVPPSWCDAHHVDPYEHGGLTDIDNLVLLCRRHHGVAHRHGWTVHITADHWTWWHSPAGVTYWSQRHGQSRAGPAPNAAVPTTDRRAA